MIIDCDHCGALSHTSEQCLVVDRECDWDKCMNCGTMFLINKQCPMCE